MSEGRTIRRALLAVYDKTGVVELARGLRELDVELVSSGGPAKELAAAKNLDSCVVVVASRRSISSS